MSIYLGGWRRGFWVWGCEGEGEEGGGGGRRGCIIERVDNLIEGIDDSNFG